MARTRLDVALVERGLAETRAAAQRLVMAGLVFSGERRLDKPHALPPTRRSKCVASRTTSRAAANRRVGSFTIPVAGHTPSTSATSASPTCCCSVARPGLCHRRRHQPTRLEAALRSARDLDGRPTSARSRANRYPSRSTSSCAMPPSSDCVRRCRRHWPWRRPALTSWR
jgi:hypothetical protein